MFSFQSGRRLQTNCTSGYPTLRQNVWTKLAVSRKSFKKPPKNVCQNRCTCFYHVLFRRIYTKLAKVYYRLRRRHNQTPSNIFSAAVTISLFWAPKEPSELPEMRSKFPSTWLANWQRLFLTDQSQRILKSWYTGRYLILQFTSSKGDLQ